MKTTIIIFTIILISRFSYSQQDKFNRELELQKFTEQGGKVEQVEPNIYKLTYRNGIARVFNFNFVSQNYNAQVNPNSTVINIWDLDTNKYSDMFTFWQKVELNNAYWAPIPIEDLNANNIPEMYGYSDVVNPVIAGPVLIYERGLDGIFKKIYTYDDSTIYIHGIGDMNSDGKKDVFINTQYPGHSKVYLLDSLTSLSTKFSYYFYEDTLQINNVAFGDFDKNGINDIAFIKGAGMQTLAISEYRNSINNFIPVYEFTTIDQGDLSGFAVEDFDDDGKTELVLGGGFGKMLVIENSGDNLYDTTWSIDYPGWAAYMQTKTNDIDHNGKKEFWIGAEDLLNGNSVFHCFESTSDNNYNEVTSIIFPGLATLNTMYLQAVDVDEDGLEELVISNGNVIVMLKFIGSPDRHNYRVFYLKISESSQPGAEFYPCALKDLNSDGKKDLIIEMNKFIEPNYYVFCYIMTNNIVTSISDTKKIIPKNIRISNYPNPFNSSTNISFSIKETSNIKIKIFNYLGKEIKTLLNKTLISGEYTISWDGKDIYDNSLPSGAYIIQLKVDNSIYHRKILLLK